MPIEVLTRQDVRDLSVVGNGLEILDWVLYDTLRPATGGTVTSFRFFQQAVGNGGISLETTNMEIPGQLPAGYKFVCQKITAKVREATTLVSADVIDMHALLERGRAELFIGTRPYFQIPMDVLSGGGLHGWDGAAATVAYAAPRTVINGELAYSPVIPANYSFSVLVNYDAAPTLAKTTDLQIRLVGKLIRPRQG